MTTEPTTTQATHRGSPERLAVLRALAQRPDGLNADELGAVLLAADGVFSATPKPTPEQAARIAMRVLYSLRATALAACEGRGPKGGRWYSPGARQAADARRTAQRLANACSATTED